MTPKEKALDLINKFSDWVYDSEFDIEDNLIFLKECSFIAVNEILNNDGFTKFDDSLTKYWYEVRKEIQNIEKL